MTQKENALRIIRFDHPGWVTGAAPCWVIGYHGVNHQSYEEEGNDAHWRPVGVKWKDIWGTGWVKDQPDVMGFPRENPLSEPEIPADYVWPDPDDPRIIKRFMTAPQLFGQADKQRNVFSAVPIEILYGRRRICWLAWKT